GAESSHFLQAQVPQRQVGQVVLFLEELGVLQGGAADVDAHNAGLRIEEGLSRRGHAAATGNQNVQVLAVGRLRPKQPIQRTQILIVPNRRRQGQSRQVVSAPWIYPALILLLYGVDDGAAGRTVIRGGVRHKEILW